MTGTSATLIDHFYTTSSGIIINDLTDHFATFHTIKHGHEKTSDQFKNVRFYTEYNIEKFKSNIDHSDFSNISRIDCPNEAYN